MKKLIQPALFLIGFSVLVLSCNSKSSSTPNNSLSAQIGTNAFNATGGSVVVDIEANPADSSQTELSITGQSGNQVLSIALADYHEGTTGTFSFSSGDALGGYADNTTSDAIVSGSLVLTQAGSTIAGTFSGTTLAGTSITSGTFSVTK